MECRFVAGRACDWDIYISHDKGEAPGLTARADAGGSGSIISHPRLRVRERCGVGASSTVSSPLFSGSRGYYSLYDPENPYMLVTVAVDRIIIPVPLPSGDFPDLVRSAASVV